MCKPLVKTLCEKSQNLWRERNAADNAIRTTFGIVKDVSDDDILLNKLIHKKAEQDEKKRQNRLAVDKRKISIWSASRIIFEVPSSRFFKRFISISIPDEGVSCASSP